MAEEQRPARFQNWKTVCASVGAVGLGYAAWRSTAMRDATHRWTEAFGNTAMDVGSQIMSAFGARVQHFQQDAAAVVDGAARELEKAVPTASWGPPQSLRPQVNQALGGQPEDPSSASRPKRTRDDSADEDEDPHVQGASTAKPSPVRRTCGTPGCKLPDHHIGPCQNEEVAVAKKRRPSESYNSVETSPRVVAAPPAASDPATPTASPSAAPAAFPPAEAHAEPASVAEISATEPAVDQAVADEPTANDAQAIFEVLKEERRRAIDESHVAMKEFAPPVGANGWHVKWVPQHGSESFARKGDVFFVHKDKGTLRSMKQLKLALGLIALDPDADSHHTLAQRAQSDPAGLIGARIDSTWAGGTKYECDVLAIRQSEDDSTKFDFLVK